MEMPWKCHRGKYHGDCMEVARKCNGGVMAGLRRLCERVMKVAWKRHGGVMEVPLTLHGGFMEEP